MGRMIHFQNLIDVFVRKFGPLYLGQLFIAIRRAAWRNICETILLTKKSPAEAEGLAIVGFPIVVTNSLQNERSNL